MVKVGEITRYEVALMRGEKVYLFLGYSARKTKRAIFSFMLAKGPEIISIVKMAACEEFTWDSNSQSYQFPGGFRVCLNRTEREIKNALSK